MTNNKNPIYFERQRLGLSRYEVAKKFSRPWTSLRRIEEAHELNQVVYFLSLLKLMPRTEQKEFIEKVLDFAKKKP